MLGTLNRYSLVAGLALISRIVLEVWPVEAVHVSQSALLEWPVFMIVLLLGYPAVHFAEVWGVIPATPDKRSTPVILGKTFLGGALFVAAFEPISQLGGSFLSSYPPTFYVVGAGAIYAVNLFQLYIFRNNGFVPMFVTRLGMHFLWHVLWGLIRLHVLF